MLVKLSLFSVITVCITLFYPLVTVANTPKLYGSGIIVDGPFGIPLGGTLFHCDTKKPLDFFKTDSLNINATGKVYMPNRNAFGVNQNFWSKFDFDVFASDYVEIKESREKLNGYFNQLHNKKYLAKYFSNKGQQYLGRAKSYPKLYFELSNMLRFDELQNIGIPLNLYFKEGTVSAAWNICVSKDKDPKML